MRTLIRLKSIAWLQAGCLLVPAVFGQESAAEKAEKGVVEIGVRGFWGDVYGRPDLPFQPALSSSKFNEYRNINNGLFLRRADVTLENVLGKGNFLNVQAQSTLLKDQAYLLTFHRPGQYKFQFRWDETPHIFSNMAQTLYTESSPGVFTLPAAIRSNLTANPGNLPALLMDAPALDLSLRRKTATLGGSVNVTDDWTLAFGFSREKQVGSRPIGTYSTGYELPEPIDYRTTRVEAQAEYGKPRGGIQFGYLGSLFDNKVDTLVWDNAFANNQGRIDLYPNSTAHSLNVAGAFDVAAKTRLMVSIAPGWMRQNDAFVPLSINPTTPGLEVPARSLNGSKQTLAMNYTLVNHPMKRLELTARYRSYDYNNNTPSLLFPGYVLLDGSRGDQLAGASRRMPRLSLPYEFNRQNVELAAAWELFPKNLFKIGYEFERYDRQHRDVRRSDENAFVTSFDLNPNKLTFIRLSYRHSGRRPDLYVDSTEGYALGLEEARRQLEDMRRFDEAARVRDRAEALLQFSPLDSLSFNLSWGTTQDNFDQSRYGLLKDISHFYTLDFDYSPRPAFSLFGEYAREKYRTGHWAPVRVPASTAVRTTTGRARIAA